MAAKKSKESKTDDASQADASGPAGPTTPEGAAAAGIPPGNGGGEQAAQPIVINAQYIKDLSFEAPTAPGIFAVMQNSQPDISININVETNLFQENIYEVALKLESQCKVGDNVGFILELEYAGLFTVNVPEEHRHAILMIECPRILFPFARNILADVSRDGGFPPVMLGPIDFVAMYQQQMQQHIDEAETKQKTDA